MIKRKFFYLTMTFNTAKASPGTYIEFKYEYKEIQDIFSDS